MANQEEQIIELIAKELTATQDPAAVINKLVEAGLSEEEARTITMAIWQQLQSRGMVGGGAMGGGGMGMGGGAGMSHGPMRRSGGGPNYMFITLMLVIVAILLWVALSR